MLERKLRLIASSFRRSYSKLPLPPLDDGPWEPVPCIVDVIRNVNLKSSGEFLNDLEIELIDVPNRVIVHVSLRCGAGRKAGL